MIEGSPAEMERRAWALLERFDDHLNAGGKTSPEAFEAAERLRARFPRRPT